MQLPVAYNKYFQPLGLGLGLLSIILYVFTGSYLVFAFPLLFFYLAVFGIDWKLAWWLMLFTVPASIQIWFFNDALSTSVPDEPLMWLFLLLFAFMFCNNPKILPEWWWRHPLVLIVFLQYLWLIVAVIFSEEHFVSIKFLLAKTWFLVSFFIFPIFIFKEKTDFKKAFFLLMIPMLVTVIIIFYRHKTMMFNFRKIEEAIGELYFNHVDYSTVISMFFPVLIVAYRLSKGKKYWERWALFFIALFFIPAIYLTYARAAMLAVIFSLMIGFAIRLRLVNLMMPVFYGLIIWLVVFLANHNKYIDYRPNYERTYMHGDFASHMAATLKGQDMSSMERLYRWIAAIRMSPERPITGVGPNAFYDFYKPFTVSAFRTYVSRNDEHSTTHNYFLYMLVEQGWPAMILYGLLVFFFFYYAQKVYWRLQDRFYKKCVLSIAMMFAAGFINNFFSELIETHKVGALFYLCIALLIVIDRKSREGDEIML
jgi:O-antigen ligase